MAKWPGRLQSIGQVAAAEELASAQAAVGRAEGNAAMFSGAMDGLSSFVAGKEVGSRSAAMELDDMPAGGLSGPGAGVPDANGWGTSTQNAYYGTGTSSLEVIRIIILVLGLDKMYRGLCYK